MDGIELTRTVRKTPELEFLPIGMFTTESRGSKMEEGKAAGATGWIAKPFDSEKLLGMVK